MSSRKALFMLSQADALESMEALKLSGALQIVSPYVKKHDRRRLTKELSMKMRAFDPFIPTEAALERKFSSNWDRMRGAFGLGKKEG